MARKHRRYSVTFHQRNTKKKEASQLLGVDVGRIRNGCDVLQLPSGIDGDDVLVFPKIGVANLKLTEEDATNLEKSGGVHAVQRDRSIRVTVQQAPLKTTRDGRFDRADAELPWNIKRIRADEAWSRATGAGVRVGVIDTGIDGNHRDLRVVGGASFIPGTDADDWDDRDGHGTACAGIIGASRNGSGVVGVAHQCDLFALKVVPPGGKAKVVWIEAAMEWAIRKRLDVVSLSLWDHRTNLSAMESPLEGLRRGAQSLLDNGCLVVGIAGNTGGSSQHHWVSNPARADSIVAVGALTQRDAWLDTSSFGPPELREREGVEIAAPGENIRSTGCDGAYVDGLEGSSFAGPHVAGAAALLKEVHPTWTPERILMRLKQTAVDVDAPRFDAKTGFGRVDCYRAVTHCCSPERTISEVTGCLVSLEVTTLSTLIHLSGPVDVRNLYCPREVERASIVIPPTTDKINISLLASSIGRRLRLTGLMVEDSCDSTLLHAETLSDILVS